jgi:hypothetical protein
MTIALMQRILFAAVIGLLTTFILWSMHDEQPKPQDWPVAHWQESGLIAFGAVAAIGIGLTLLTPRRRLV